MILGDNYLIVTYHWWDMCLSLDNTALLVYVTKIWGKQCFISLFNVFTLYKIDCDQTFYTLWLSSLNSLNLILNI